MGVPFDDTPQVGGPSDSGSATAFDRFQDWGVRGLFTAGPNAGNLEFFGTSVAIQAKTAVVGAPDDGSNGAAYVFVAPYTPVTPWALETQLPQSTPSQAFGSSVAVDGDSAVVGAPEQSTVFGQGQVHMFARSGISWSEEQVLLGPSGVVSFGRSVAVSGDIAVIGAPLQPFAGESERGVGVRLRTLGANLGQPHLHHCQ